MITVCDTGPLIAYLNRCSAEMTASHAAVNHDGHLRNVGPLRAKTPGDGGGRSAGRKVAEIAERR